MMVWVGVNLVTAVARGQNVKIAPELLQVDPESSVDVIVQLRQATHDEGLSRLISRGVRHNRKLSLIRSSVFSVKAREIGALADDPDVEYIALDHQVRGTEFSGTADYGWMAVSGIGERYGRLPYDGSNIGIAVIDSGVDRNRDFDDARGRSRIVYSESFVPGDNSVVDAYGHGSHVAGLIGGSGANSSGGPYLYWIRGIAPAVNLINLRVLDGKGASTDSTVIAAIERTLQLKSRFNIRVMNLSLGRPVTSSYAVDPLCKAVQQAWEGGIVVVVAAGNEGRNNSVGTHGYGTITSPGNSPYVITVGAINTVGTASRSDDKIASYSSKGPTLFDYVIKPDLMAPGNRIFSVRDKGSYLDEAYPENRVPVYVYAAASNEGTPHYFQLSGTSMATPMVAGAAALLLQKDASLTPDELKARLMKTASKFPQTTSVATDPTSGVQYVSQYDIFSVGAGYLDIQAALANEDIAGGLALSPTAAFDSSTGNVYLVADNSAPWGNSAAWAGSAVWGISAILGSSAAWGSSVLWGSSAAWGAGSLWGSDGVFGSSAAWGSARISVDAVSIAISSEN
jgi:serine protease AprX